MSMFRPAEKTWALSFISLHHRFLFLFFLTWGSRAVPFIILETFFLIHYFHSAAGSASGVGAQTVTGLYGLVLWSLYNGSLRLQTVKWCCCIRDCFSWWWCNIDTRKSTTREKSPQLSEWQGWTFLFFLLCCLPLTGYFTQISTLADVQENVMEYLHVLSRPKVIDQEHDTVWTEAYIDSTVSRPSVSTPPVRLCALLNTFLNASLKPIELRQSPLDRVSEYELQMKLLRRQASCAVWAERRLMVQPGMSLSSFVRTNMYCSNVNELQIEMAGVC